MTTSFHRKRWTEAAVNAPRHDAVARTALAEAVALVERGRTLEVRQALARHILEEPTIREPWVRSLVQELRR